MIPTIEQIVEDLKAGTITASQAVTWLHQHAQGAANELRDMFAGLALQGMLCNGFMPSEVSQHGRIPYDYPGAAYEMADAMLKAREPQHCSLPTKEK